eukprot:scaffold43339_cov32-Tisochrysis_lutea.AAC.3
MQQRGRVGALRDGRARKGRRRTGSAQKVPIRRLVMSWRASILCGSECVINMRKNVEPALSTLTRWRAMMAANRSSGETGDPSSSTDGVWVNSAAEIMYAWPVIQPGVATTNSTSRGPFRRDAELCCEMPSAMLLVAQIPI